jgi:hypothetical protein
VPDTRGEALLQAELPGCHVAFALAEAPPVLRAGPGGTRSSAGRAARPSSAQPRRP